MSNKHATTIVTTTLSQINHKKALGRLYGYYLSQYETKNL